MTKSTKVTVKPASEQDFAGWCPLYHGYAEFYEVPMNDEILRTTWSWIMDENHEVEALLAFLEGESKPCGLAHVRRMPRPLGGNEIGFLDDMFVDPSSRGKKVGETLFHALQKHGQQKGWSKIRWITADDNYRARGLYGKLSTKTMWNTYEMIMD